MKIQPIQPNQPSMQMKYQQKVYKYGLDEKIKDCIKLDNGKQLTIIKYKNGDSLTAKLVSLKDELGNWVKSKLKYYRGRQVTKTINSYAQGD